jgi:L,D-transpeptidase ErfK/SrfK
MTRAGTSRRAAGARPALPPPVEPAPPPRTWPYGAAYARPEPWWRRLLDPMGWPAGLFRGLRGVLGVLAVLAALALLGAAASLLAGFRYRDLDDVVLPDGTVPARPDVRPAARAAGPAKLARRIAEQAPPGVYVAIDTIANRLYVKRGPAVLLAAPCSTGTGGILTDPATGRRWVFDTPRGAYKVLAKARKPLWHKPDWAFVEEGLPVPSDPAQRVDDYSLGGYALSLGDGYLIHGTLYERLLGRSVTHGCIRLGDADLRKVYDSVPVGAPVFIY